MYNYDFMITQLTDEINILNKDVIYINNEITNLAFKVRNLQKQINKNKELKANLEKTKAEIASFQAKKNKFFTLIKYVLANVKSDSSLILLFLITTDLAMNLFWQHNSLLFAFLIANHSLGQISFAHKKWILLNHSTPESIENKMNWVESDNIEKARLGIRRLQDITDLVYQKQMIEAKIRMNKTLLDNINKMNEQYFDKKNINESAEYNLEHDNVKIYKK